MQRNMKRSPREFVSFIFLPYKEYFDLTHEANVRPAVTSFPFSSNVHVRTISTRLAFVTFLSPRNSSFRSPDYKIFVHLDWMSSSWLVFRIKVSPSKSIESLSAHLRRTNTSVNDNCLLQWSPCSIFSKLARYKSTRTDT